MNSVKSVICVLVFGATFAGSIDAAHAATGNAMIQTTDGSNIFISVNGQDESVKSYNLDDMASQKDLNGLTNRVVNIDDDLNDTKTGVLLINNDLQAAKQLLADKAQIAQDTANQALNNSNTNTTDINLIKQQAASGAFNGKDGVDGKDGATGAQGATGAAGAAGLNGSNGVNGKDGQNGKDGANGVTTTVTQVQVDTVTRAKVDQNAKTTASTAQDLQATKQAVQAMNNNNSQQFKSLRDEVDSNKKQANAGISGAMAMAGLPQVQTNQRVMFSAGGATYNGESALAVGASVNFNESVIAKVSFSDDTANNMGASVGVGVGF